jgi:hypothetical protein
MTSVPSGWTPIEWSIDAGTDWGVGIPEKKIFLNPLSKSHKIALKLATVGVAPGHGAILGHFLCLSLTFSRVDYMDL